MGAVAAGALALGPSPEAIGQAPPAGDHDLVPMQALDVRSADIPLAPTAGQTEALTSLAESVPGLRVRWDRRFGTPASLVADGPLAGPAAGAPADVARSWLRSRSALFGWASGQADALLEVKTLAQPRGGPVVVLFHQTFGGLEARSFGGSIVVTLDRSNQVLSVRSSAVRTPALATAATLTPTDALRIAGVSSPAITGTRAGFTVFAPGGLAGPHYVRPIAFPRGTGVARPAYEVFLIRALDQGDRLVVDAVDGTVLYRHELVDHQADEDEPATKGRVFRNYPGAAAGGEHEVVSFDGDPKASPNGWVTGPTTVGNNASTATNWGVFIAPDGPGQLRPVAPDGNFDFPFTDAWAESECGANPISEELQFPDSPTYAEDALPAVVNLFFHHNLMHDYFYKLGFTEEAGAMQADNFGKGGAAGDPIIGLVQAGAAAGDQTGVVDPLGRDNAYMFPLEDGLPQWSGMFLFEPIIPANGGFLAPCVDGDFTADVIYHEYAHGVTNRWVGAEYGNLDTHHGGSMGESWGDFYGMHYLFQKGLTRNDAVGPYDTGNHNEGIRNWAMGDVPVGFGDIGYDLNGEEVHSDGEIWNGVLWDLRAALPNSYAAQIIADAMPVSGPLPTMVDMRDAILTSDVARTGGEHKAALWSVFARHGLGRSASAIDANDINPVPAFDHADASRNGRISGRLVAARTGKPIAQAKVIIGEYEGRVSPVVRSGTRGTFSFPIQAGTYPLTVQAKGYGARTFEVTVRRGGTLRKDFVLAPNLASTSAGAKVVDASNPSTLGIPEYALDDTEGSTWWTNADDDPNGEWFVVDLAGRKPVRIERLQVSALRSPGGNRFESLEDFEVYASNDGAKWTKIRTGSFPTHKPRPITPKLHYKKFGLAKPVEAKFLKFVGSPQDATAGGLQVAEVQAFGRGDVVVDPKVSAGDPPFHDEGVVAVASADSTATYNLMSAVCTYPPPTQGLDAWVTELPDSYGDGTHIIDVKATPLAADPRPDVDVYFLSADCQATGDVASTAPRETGTIPQGSKYVVSQLYTTAGATISVDATSGG